MRLCLFSFLFLFLLCPASNNVRQHEMSFNVGSPRNIPPTPSIRGTIVKEDQILLVKIGKCMGFCMYRRSYVLWSLVIVEGTRPRDDLNKQTNKTTTLLGTWYAFHCCVLRSSSSIYICFFSQIEVRGITPRLQKYFFGGEIFDLSLTAYVF